MTGSRPGAVILASGEGGAGMAAAIDCLAAGGTPLDAVEAGVRAVEIDPRVRSVGRGGAPNILGEMECDAAVMCGTTLKSGAVGALKDYLHAISVARAVMERTPHVMLVGAGAARFAGEVAAERGELLDRHARSEYRKWLRIHVPASRRARLAQGALADLVQPPRGAASAASAFSARGTAGGAGGKAERSGARPKSRPGSGRGCPHDTVGFLVRRGDGATAGGISTSGWAYKYPGRMSDSGLIGAGLYVDDRYGAAACTHTGEMIIRAGVARAVLAYMKRGATVEEACREAFDDLRSLRGGHLGPVIVHAFDNKGRACVLTTGGDGGIPYWHWTEGMKTAKRCKPAVESL